MIRVAVVNNLANSMFYRVKALRELEVDAHLFIGSKSRDSSGELRPDSLQDPFYLTGETYPWVHILDFTNPVRALFYNSGLFKDFDIIHSCCLAPIANQFFLGRRKFIAHANGSDLRVFALRHDFKPALLRRAYRRADLILYDDLDEGTLSAGRGLGLSGKMRHLGYVVEFPKPVALNVEKRPEEFSIFYPGRQNSRIKGTGLFFDALEGLAEKGLQFTMDLIAWGEEVEASRQRLSAGPLAGRVRWHPLIDRGTLAGLYAACDAVAGYFVHDGQGVAHYPQVLIEGLYFGKPVVSTFDEPVVHNRYPDFPVLIARSRSEIAAWFESLISSRDRARELGEKGRRWWESHAAPSSVAAELLEMYRSIR